MKFETQKMLAEVARHLREDGDKDLYRRFNNFVIGVKKTEKALRDEPGNAEMFAKGFVYGFKKNKPHDNSE